jgi:putative spermidine/putrescine transport system ATP-binding protein
LHLACEAPREGRHWLVTRPEKVRVAGGAAALNGANVLSAIVRDVVYQGDSFLCYATLAGGEQIALRDYCRSDVLSLIPRAGEQIRLQITAEDASIVADQ